MDKEKNLQPKHAAGPKHDTAAASGKAPLNERAAAFLCGILLLIVILITATQTLCYWIPGWWEKEYAKYNTPQYVTGEMSLDDAVYITEQMLEYCIGRLDTLDNVEATIDGEKVPFFTEREKLHLADCRNIFLGAVRFRVVSVLMICGLLLAIWFSVSKRHPDDTRKAFSRVLASGYLKALAAAVIFGLFLVFLGSRDFTFLFTKFHHVFFDNDLWILDPRHDNLVNVMREAVFEDAAITIGMITAGAAAFLAAASGLILRKTRH